MQKVFADIAQEIAEKIISDITLEGTLLVEDASGESELITRKEWVDNAKYWDARGNFMGEDVQDVLSNGWGVEVDFLGEGIPNGITPKEFDGIVKSVFNLLTVWAVKS